jgi:predicted Rossmann fold nucleotide-binding protein DprA/Smf involved in DNA uptake
MLTQIQYHSLGNINILTHYKVAFLCSRKCPGTAILKSFDWAIERREKSTCVISGFHSGVEQDVLHYLLMGTQPIILALARGFKKRLEPELQTALDAGRILIITPFAETVKRITKETATQRNRLMLDIADEVVIAHSSPGGNLERLCLEYEERKRISTF